MVKKKKGYSTVDRILDKRKARVIKIFQNNDIEYKIDCIFDRLHFMEFDTFKILIDFEYRNLYLYMEDIYKHQNFDEIKNKRKFEVPNNVEYSKDKDEILKHKPLFIEIINTLNEKE